MREANINLWSNWKKDLRLWSTTLSNNKGKVHDDFKLLDGGGEIPES